MDGITFERFARGLTDNLEEPVRKHLKNVYATVTLATMCAAIGGYVHLYSTLVEAGLLTCLGSIGFLIALSLTPCNGKNGTTRLALLGCFAFLAGVNLGPLLSLAITFNPALVIHALMGTAIVFICFSLAALYAPRGQYLYLGGPLMSALSMLFWLSMLNLMFGSRLLFQVNLYVGLLVMCGFIVYDTQSIIDKVRHGDKDFIMHSLYLFIDFISVFKKLLIILTDKEAQDKRKRK